MKTTLGRTSRQLLILGAVMLGAFAPLPALAQLITTYAGGATPIDGAQATTQSFDAVNSVLSDRFGGFYLSSSGSDQHRVYRVSSNGVLTVIAGTGAPGFSGDGGPALSAQLSDPDGLALDASGNLFIADRGNNRIRKVTPAGIISTFAGAGGGGGFSGDGGPAISARLNYPTDIAVDFTGAV